MIPIKLGVDIDNVICSTTQTVLDVYYENTGERLQLSDIKTYNIEDYVSEEYKEEFYRIFLDKRVWENVEILPNCAEIIKQLHNTGHDIYFVTATEPANIYKKFELLCCTFPFINVKERLIATQHKQMTKLDILIDDCVDNVIGGDYYGILFDYPWNHNFDDASDDKIYRVFDWAQVEPMIEYIQKVKC